MRHAFKLTHNRENQHRSSRLCLCCYGGALAESFDPFAGGDNGLKLTPGQIHLNGCLERFGLLGAADGRRVVQDLPETIRWTATSEELRSLRRCFREGKRRDFAFTWLVRDRPIDGRSLISVGQIALLGQE